MISDNKIWMYWNDGLENAPKSVQLCINSWKVQNKNYEVVVLEDNTISEWIDIPKFQDTVMTIQAFSNILRIFLLSKYGGIWADATLWCTKPVDGWVDNYSDDFFVFSNPTDSRMIASWFVKSSKDNIILKEWKDRVIDYIENTKVVINNFWFHGLFEKIYNENIDVKNQWDSVLKYDVNRNNRVLENPLYFSKITDDDLDDLDDDFKFGVLNKTSPMYKLGWTINWLDTKKVKFLMSRYMNFENLRFIHIPKTGGTSIGDAAKENNLLWGKFDKELKSTKGCSAWHSPQKISGYSFCVIRCPYERIISEFYHQNKIIDYTEENLNKFIQRILSKINRNNYIHNAHFLEQYKFYEYCDIAISFENLETNLNKLMKIFNLPLLKLDHLPGGDKQQVKRDDVQFTRFNKDDINGYNLKLIKEKYHLDFVLWDKVKKNSILFKSDKLMDRLASWENNDCHLPYKMINKIPYLHSESDDFLVFYKPPFWSCNDPTYKIDDPRVLASFELATRNFPTWVAKYMKDNLNLEASITDWYNLLHRYDYETSGMILVGKDTKNLQNLKEKIIWSKFTNKYYYALVNGILDEKEGDIIKPIKENWPNCSTISDEGEAAHSRYEVVKEFDNKFSLVKVRLVVGGKTHQIRIHMKSIGHPLVSDSMYMNDDYKELLQDNLNITPNFQLHNYRLDFMYKNKEYEFESSLPKSFERVLESISINKKHAVLTSGRTGSNLLCAILNMHPECINRGEIFGEIRNLFLDKIFWDHPDYMIENFWFKDYSEVKSSGFKYLYFQDLKRDNKISDFVAKSGFKVIHLKRKNKLKQYISWKKVLESNSWGDDYLITKGKNPWLNKKVHVDGDELLERFKIEKEQEQTYRNKFPDALEIYYEDMVSDFDLNFTNENNKILQKCFEYLNLDYQRMIDGKQDVNSFLKETDLFALKNYDLESYTGEIKNDWFDIVDSDNKDFILQKTRILPLSKCISNYDEVKEKLTGTEYEIYLDGTSDIIVAKHDDIKNKLYKILESNDVDIELLKENKVFIKGGAILRLFLDLPLETDIDFFFPTHKSFERVDNSFKEKYDLRYKTSVFKVYRGNNLDLSFTTLEDLVGNYEDINKYTDFNIAAGCFDFNTEMFKYPKFYLDDIKNRVLKVFNFHYGITGENYPNALIRIEKYQKMGFTIDEKIIENLTVSGKQTVVSEINQRIIKKSWLRNVDVYPIVPNIDIFVNWLMDIKKHKYFNKFNYYLTGGFISWPEKTKDIDIIITKRDGQQATLKELEKLMVDMFDSAYDNHKFFLDTFYMRTPQWIADYPRDREVLKSVERKQLFITITKYEDTEIVCKYRRYGLLNCAYTGSFTLRGTKPSVLVDRWIDLNSNYTRWVDLRKIIKYYENNNKRNIEDFKEKFQEYSGY